MFTLEDQFICHSESYLTQETFVRVCQEAVQMKLSVSSTRKANLPRSPLSLLPLFSRPWAFYVLLLILSNQTLPRTLPANHVSAVKLKTTLLPVVSCHFGHSCSSYPALLSRVISLSSDLQCLSTSIATIGVQNLSMGFLFYAQLHPLPEYHFISMESDL